MPINLPKILIIDDQFGSSLRDRRNLCALFGFKDITGDDISPEQTKEPLSEAFFCSGQIRTNGRVENSINLSHDAVIKGWASAEGWRWSLIFLDLRFVSGSLKDNNEPKGQDGDDTFGLLILDDIHKGFPDIPIIVMSSRDRADVIEECRKKGAYDFIQRIGYGTEDKSPREILIQKILEHGLIEDNRILENEKLRITGSSIAIMKALRDARRAATGAGNILLLGETGTGKELLARYIHDMSPKSDSFYVVFHPFGTAETLQEDELFGHVKGAFTDAKSDKAGLFEQANNGTLFIDEVGDIPESLQSKLLRPLENRAVKRQGGDKEIHLDVQIVLATNKNLDEFAKTERFKSDLLNRIRAYPIAIPPLRERKEDIPVIAERLLEILCREHNARWPRKILPETMGLLKTHDWPDNVRGLRNVMERAVKNNKDSELIVPSDIRFDTYATETERQEIFEKATIVIADPIDDLIERLSTFEFPRDYANISGKLPALQEAVAKMLANYMLSAIEVTKKMKPGSSAEGELNLTGAVSCMMGEQLKTPKAADMIKKILQMDGESLEKLLKENPVLNKAYTEALRLRPKKPKGV
ncbi:MAG: sigma-54-dependent Fis family transcriptional regulator [Nitrospinae bacterium]|nr:sigma-54-dependent Fis family transcriptional regulator [Nitrospinota bacterium]